MPSALSLENIAEAARVIDPVFLRSPQFISESLSARLGFPLLCKVECINPIRSFKGRGTNYLLHKLGPTKETLVAASAGNFGQGLAYAARARGVPVVLFAAENANPLKVDRMRAFGADVRLAGADFDAAKQAARQYAARPGHRFIEDGRESAIAEGAGTIGMELAAWPQKVDTLFVPVGNGALIAGVGRWFKAVSPQTQIVGVVAAEAPAMQLSWRSHRVVTTERAETIADGIAVREPVPEALEEMASVVDDMISVREAELREAMRLAFHELGLVVEPAGAAGLAAASLFRDQFRGQLVATILCGGNVIIEKYLRWDSAYH
jgi:threonine dehydratase